jgi:hypothetical protein
MFTARISKDPLTNPPQLCFVEWFGYMRHSTERWREKRYVVVARRDYDPYSKLLQLWQDLENLPAAQIDVKHRTVEALSLGVLQDLIDACQRTHHVATRVLQHLFQFEANKPFILGEKDAPASQQPAGVLVDLRRGGPGHVDEQSSKEWSSAEESPP